MVGDGECDDLTNTHDCQYDQGDCCFEYIDDTYCITCICHETGLKHNVFPKLDKKYQISI